MLKRVFPLKRPTFFNLGLPKIPKANIGRYRHLTMPEVEDYANKKTVLTQNQQFEADDRARYLKFVKLKYATNMAYVKIQDKWKNNLIRKAKKRERREETKLAEKSAENMPTKLIIHSPLATTLVLNAQTKHDSFAVISLNGFQHKVSPDDLLVVDRLNNLKVGEVVSAEKVHLIGSKHFTLLGRPFVENAAVFLSVEQQTLSKKLIVFKKKRRKGYRRSSGHRQPLTVFRINRIEYDIDPVLAARAVKIWDN